MKIKSYIKMVQEGQCLKAIADIVLEDSFVIRGIRVVEGKNGLFISFPAKRIDDEFVDICFARTPELREKIRDSVLNEYEKILAKENNKK